MEEQKPKLDPKAILPELEMDLSGLTDEERERMLDKLHFKEGRLLDAVIDCTIFIIQAANLQQGINQVKNKLGVEEPQFHYPDELHQTAAQILSEFIAPQDPEGGVLH